MQDTCHQDKCAAVIVVIPHLTGVNCEVFSISIYNSYSIYWAWVGQVAGLMGGGLSEKEHKANLALVEVKGDADEKQF